MPFYLRSGKVMSCRTTQIVVQFREPPFMLFPDGPRSVAESNRLVIQVQPAEGIQLHFETKVPDAGMKLRQTDLEFSYQREFRGAIPEAYERLLLDALEGDASLFARADEVEAAWTIIDPILAEWQKSDQAGTARLRAGLLGTVRVQRVDGSPGTRVVRYLPRVAVSRSTTGPQPHDDRPAHVRSHAKRPRAPIGYRSRAGACGS